MAKNKPRKLFELGSDPNEAINVAAAHPDESAILTVLAAKSHKPAVEGTFASTERYQQDRRARGTNPLVETQKPKKKQKQTAK